ncbi:MAG: RDD family protein [Chromatiales bacterium]|nr:RDD family protein [Chromatiales bacterium]
MSEDIYKTPDAELVSQSEGGEPEYAGFWIRVAASIVDNILISIIIFPLLFLIYGGGYLTDESFYKGPADVFLNYLFPMIVIIAFWVYKSATPGKMLVKTKIVDARTGGKPSTWQFIGRYFGYIVSTLPLLLGLIWVAFDKRKQGWHDKLAKTVVIIVK